LAYVEAAPVRHILADETRQLLLLPLPLLLPLRCSAIL
jgi:hypothetical protein